MAVLAPPIQEAIHISKRYLYMKRVLDVMLTLLFLPLLGSITLIVAVAIRLDSPGPIFFRQKRVGQIGIEFTLYKFRSMHVDNNDAIHREAVKKYMNGETLHDSTYSNHTYKLVCDPRITRVGRFLRKTSLDELPQFINVLRGEMSLAGPRPPLEYEVEEYSERDSLRLCGKPGLTGMWQVYGRSRVSFKEMVEMDIAYLQQQSIWQDLKLMLLTIPVMIMQRGGA